ncbi:hypothetical protein RHS02_01612, partial [Rhizoctonia solani]
MPLKHTRAPAWKPRSQPHDKFYQVESPQEFDERDNELGPDAQVWKTYVKETEQIDGEQVDAWNKLRVQVNGCDTEFVIESYKNLKKDPEDSSAQILLFMSQLLATMTNGSQELGVQLSNNIQLKQRGSSPCRLDICVNFLWFLSLSLSVAVTLTSMLAKEWCLTFMLGRTGPPGARARERQQRWDGIVCWKMEEVVMLLPSLIHMSLRLCIFLWEINRVVASPVIAVTTIVALAYLTCTVLPLVRKHCPYGTMISTFMKRSTRSHFRTRQVGITQDAITAKALNWMIGNCQTPRSVDVALQSLAGATKDLPWDTLADSGIWSMIRHRLGTNDPFSHYSDLGTATYARALQQILVIGGNTSIIHSIKKHESSVYVITQDLLQRCAHLGVRFLIAHNIEPQLPDTNKLGKSHTSIKIAANDVELAEDITQRLERHLNGEIDIGTTSYAVLSAILALLHTSSVSDNRSIATCTMRLIHAYIGRMERFNQHYSVSSDSRKKDRAKIAIRNHEVQERELNMLAWVAAAIDLPSRSPEGVSKASYDRYEHVASHIWRFLIESFYSEANGPKHDAQKFRGVLHLIANHQKYKLNSTDHAALKTFLSASHLDHSIFHNKQEFVRSDSEVQLGKVMCECLPSFGASNPQECAELVKIISDRYKRFSPGQRQLVLTPGVYIFVIKGILQKQQTEHGDPEVLYGLLADHPFPKLSPDLVKLLISENLVSQLSDASRDHKHLYRGFAIAQLWLILHSSLPSKFRVYESLAALEATLVQDCRLLKGDISMRRSVIEQLEIDLESLLADHAGSFNSGARGYSYLYRILECMPTKRDQPLTANAESWLRHVPNNLRGLASSVYLAGEEQ